MSTFQPAPDTVAEMARSILDEFPAHKATVRHGVKIDYVFAFASVDDHGNRKGCALKKNGVRALGICRIVNLKDRAMGRGDVEIALDADWWESAIDAQRFALLDHELNHVLAMDVERDDLGRPKIRLRKHDVDVGWFRDVAARHGEHSMERIQAAQILEDHGQYFWPEITGGATHPIDSCTDLARDLVQEIMASSKVSYKRAVEIAKEIVTEKRKEVSA